MIRFYFHPAPKPAKVAVFLETRFCTIAHCCSILTPALLVEVL